VTGGGTGPLLLAFASAAERRACAPHRLLAACGSAAGVALSAIQVGVAAARLGELGSMATGARGLWSCGLAGGLDPALPSGTLLLPGRILAGDGSSIELDPRWHARALDRLQPLGAVATGTLAHAGVLLAGPAQKQQLRQASGAMAVDMESAVLAHWAGHRRLPFLVLRVVLDPATVALPEWSQVALRPDGSTNLAALSGALLRRPAGLLELAGMARGLGAASARWRAALLALGPALLPGAPAA
jgi:adenosylhomocysteine nucleosidase